MCQYETQDWKTEGGWTGRTEQDYGDGDQDHEDVVVAEEGDEALNADGETDVGHACGGGGGREGLPAVWVADATSVGSKDDSDGQTAGREVEVWNAAGRGVLLSCSVSRGFEGMRADAVESGLWYAGGERRVCSGLGGWVVRDSLCFLYSEEEKCVWVWV